MFLFVLMVDLCAGQHPEREETKDDFNVATNINCGVSLLEVV